MKRIYAVIVVELSDAAIADSPYREMEDNEKRIAQELEREYVVETVDVFRVEHYT